jgi:hypothetical protein
MQISQWTTALFSVGLAGTLSVIPASARTQSPDPDRRVAQVRDSSDGDIGGDAEGSPHYHFRSHADSLSWVRARDVAERSTGFRIVVSLQDRHLWAIVDEDTVLSAPAAVAKGTTLDSPWGDWRFTTPRGLRHVLDKEADPIWIPPDWLYAETAMEHGLKLAHLEEGRVTHLSDGRTLTIRDGVVGVSQDGEFAALPITEHIVFDNTLFVPPTSTQNRHVNGTLGKFRLDLGEGYLLHGTPDKNSIGLAATHGCVRLGDEDIEWLYENVPVGTPVYIY